MKTAFFKLCELAAFVCLLPVVLLLAACLAEDTPEDN